MKTEPPSTFGGRGKNTSNNSVFIEGSKSLRSGTWRCDLWYTCSGYIMNCNSVTLSTFELRTDLWYTCSGCIMNCYSVTLSTFESPCWYVSGSSGLQCVVQIHSNGEHKGKFRNNEPSCESCTKTVREKHLFHKVFSGGGMRGEVEEVKFKCMSCLFCQFCSS